MNLNSNIWIYFSKGRVIDDVYLSFSIFVNMVVEKPGIRKRKSHFLTIIIVILKEQEAKIWIYFVFSNF